MSEPSTPLPDRDRYVTRPTRFTVFLRTFLPWQLWRFVRINVKMFGIIRQGPGGEKPGPEPTGSD